MVIIITIMVLELKAPAKKIRQQEQKKTCARAQVFLVKRYRDYIKIKGIRCDLEMILIRKAVKNYLAESGVLSLK